MRKSALVRRGLHHADIRGRFIDGDGNPIAGVRTHLHSGKVGGLPVREAVSDAHGRFTILDADTVEAPGLVWFPPEGWLQGGTSLIRESFEEIDLGEIRLEPETKLWVTVASIDGKPLDDPALDRLSIALEAVSGRRRGADRVGDLWVFERLPFEDARWAVTFRHREQGWEHFVGDFNVKKGSSGRFLTLRLHRDAAGGSGDGTVEAHEALTLPTDAKRQFRATGRLVTPDGSPVDGVSVSVNDLFGDIVPESTLTNAASEFELSYRAIECKPPHVFLAGGGRLAFDQAVTQGPCEELWMSGRTLTLSFLSRLVVQVEDVDRDDLQLHWWQPNVGWSPFEGGRLWIGVAAWKRTMLVKLSSPRFLPQVREIELPTSEDRDEGAPPEQVAANLAFERDGLRELTVTAGGRPVEGAVVDIEWIQDLSRDKRIPLASYRTDAGGKLQLAGGSRQLVEVFVYSRGFEPGRAVWEPGRPLTLELAPRTARLSLTGLWPGYQARIHASGQAGAVRTLRARVGKERSMSLVAGTYDVVVHNATGHVVGYQRVAVGPGETRELDATVDRRPRLTIRYPEPGWTAAVSQSTPVGTAVGWVAYSTPGGSFAVADVLAQMESETLEESVLLLSRAGRFQVQVQPRRYDHSLWREFEIKPGEAITLEVPAAEAALRGSMRSYDGGLGYSHHGWAGPRLQLISDDPARWSITVYLPNRDGEHTFTLPGLPAGKYHLCQHLIGTPKSHRDNSGREHHYTMPLHAWGGIPVELRADGTAALNDFIDYPFQDIEATVLDSAGRPLNGATLRVRDRMSEAWRQIGEGPTSLAYAAHPIPYPPAVRVRDGRASLPSIRAGRLEMTVELDDGLVHSFTAEVDPAKPLTIQLPAGGNR